MTETPNTIESIRVSCKDPNDEPKLSTLDFRLWVLIDHLKLFAKSNLCFWLMVTDVDSPGVHMGGSPHYDHRAVDFRLAPLGLDRCVEWGSYINSRFDYPGHRIVLVGPLDPEGLHNDHLHIQVPRPYRATGRIIV